MRGSKFLGVVAAASLVAMPTIANAAQASNPAAALSLAPAGKMRVSTTSKRKSNLQGAALVLVVVAGAAAVAGIVAAADGGSSN